MRERPITDDDDTIAAALEDVSIPTLMLSLVHMTGDPSIIRGRAAPAGPVPQRGAGLHVRGGQGRGAHARARRHPRLPRPRQRPAPAPSGRAPARDDDVARVRGRARGVRPDDARGDGARRRRRAAGRTSTSTTDARAAFPVVVIGCGQSGLLAGIRLKEAGIPFTIIEKNAGVGGTWYENTYPGCRVDVGNHFYCYCSSRATTGREFFAQQPELQRYFADVMQQARHRPARAVGDRGGRRAVGRGRRRPGRYGCARADGTRGDARRARGDLRGRPAQPARSSRTSPGVEDVRGPVVPLRALGSRRRHRAASASR